MGEYADAAVFDYDDLCPHDRIVCGICARGEGFDEDEVEDDEG